MKLKSAEKYFFLNYPDFFSTSRSVLIFSISCPSIFKISSFGFFEHFFGKSLSSIFPAVTTPKARYDHCQMPGGEIGEILWSFFVLLCLRILSIYFNIQITENFLDVLASTFKKKEILFENRNCLYVKFCNISYEP